MGVHARIRCFCSSAVCPEDPPGTTSSEWCALTCGHIWHTKCAQRWARESNDDRCPCPNRCPQERVSRKDPVTGQRRLFPFVKLYFDEDVQSDGLDSSQIIDVGHDTPSSGGLKMGIGAYGQPFLTRPPKSKGKKRAMADGGSAGEDGEDDEDIEIVEEEAEGAAKLEQELTRLRRELREAMVAARQVGELRQQVERLKQVERNLQAEVSSRDDTITALQDEAKERDEENEQLELGQPKLRDALQQAQEDIEVLEATRIALDEVIEEMKKSIKELIKERDEARNDLHEARIKSRETINRLELRVKAAGTAGEERIRAMEREVEDLNRLILDVRCEKDRIELTKDEELKKVRTRATKEVEKAQKTVEEAEQARQMAVDEAKQAKAHSAKISGANENWRIKCDKLKVKCDKLKSRRAAISDDEVDEGDDLPLPPTVVHSPDKSLRRLPSHRSAFDSSPEALPFRLNMNASNLPYTYTASAHSTVNAPSPIPSPAPTVKRKRQASDVIVISSDEDAEEEYGEDLFAADPFASGSGTWSGFGADARLPSQSPGSKKRRAASTVPMPTLAESTSATGAAARWAPKKTELTQQRSDKHLPNFASGAKELGPKSRVKMGMKRA